MKKYKILVNLHRDKTKQFKQCVIVWSSKCNMNLMMRKLSFQTDFLIMKGLSVYQRIVSYRIISKKGLFSTWKRSIFEIYILFLFFVKNNNRILKFLFEIRFGNFFDYYSQLFLNPSTIIKITLKHRYYIRLKKHLHLIFQFLSVQIINFQISNLKS